MSEALKQMVQNTDKVLCCFVVCVKTSLIVRQTQCC